MGCLGCASAHSVGLDDPGTTTIDFEHYCRPVGVALERGDRGNETCRRTAADSFCTAGICATRVKSPPTTRALVAAAGGKNFRSYDETPSAAAVDALIPTCRTTGSRTARLRAPPPTVDRSAAPR